MAAALAAVGQDIENMSQEELQAEHEANKNGDIALALRELTQGFAYMKEDALLALGAEMMRVFRGETDYRANPVTVFLLISEILESRETHERITASIDRIEPQLEALADQCRTRALITEEQARTIEALKGINAIHEERIAERDAHIRHLTHLLDEGY